MPFTPFHFGPGLLLKSASPQKVSFTAFALTQVAVDLEPLYFILRRDPHAHRAMHTVLGAGAVGLAVGLAVWALARHPAFARRWPMTPGSAAGAEVERGPALRGGLIGGVSHPLLDGLMHSDMHPLRPLADVQWLLDAGGVAAVYLGCAIAGLLGVALLVVQRGKP